MTPIKLVALDLDNTLFDDQKQVSSSNKLAIQKAKQQGVKVVVTTGRPLAAIDGLLEKLGLDSPDDYSVTFNGGLVQKNDGQILAKSQLTKAEVLTIYRAAQELDLPVDVVSEGRVYSLASASRQSLYPTANPMLDFTPLADLDDLPDDIIYNKVVLVTEPAYLDRQLTKLPADLHEQFEIFKSRDMVLEFMPKGIHKAKGLERLCRLLAIEQEAVMAIGDEANDLSMISWAGLGVAMANATEAVKAAAKVTTQKDNNHSGVAEAIQNYVLNGDENGLI